jgi:hypothetical protein
MSVPPDQVEICESTSKPHKNKIYRREEMPTMIRPNAMAEEEMDEVPTRLCVTSGNNLFL